MKELFKKIFRLNSQKNDNTLKGEELINWQFDELVINLITISSDADRQKEIIGLGEVACEMAEDFHTYYSTVHKNYTDNNLLTLEQKSELDKLDKFFAFQFEEKESQFWDDEQLATNSNWKEARSMAQRILKILGKDDLTIEFERTTENTTSKKGEELIIEKTKAHLKKKNIS